MVLHVRGVRTHRYKAGSINGFKKDLAGKRWYDINPDLADAKELHRWFAGLSQQEIDHAIQLYSKTR